MPSHLTADDARRAEGAVYTNSFYPGYIAVPPNSVFLVQLPELVCVLRVVRHVRPIVVTDFGNDFIEIERDGLRFQRLRREIAVEPANTIAAHGRRQGGGPEPLFFVTKEHDYCLYRRQAFTEVTVGYESARLEAGRGPAPGIWRDVLTRFITLYRLVAVDVSVAPPMRLRRDFPVVRSAVVRYGAVRDMSTVEERVLRHLPRTFHPELFKVDEFYRGLRPPPPLAGPDLERLGYHVRAGTAILGVQEAVVDAFEQIKEHQNPRFGLIDVFSAAEVATFDFLNQLRRGDHELDKRLRKKESDGALTMRVAINSFLPGLLAEQMKTWPDLIKDLDVARKRRDGALHRGESVAGEEAVAAVNAVQHLVFAIEDYSGRFGAGSGTSGPGGAPETGATRL